MKLFRIILCLVLLTTLLFGCGNQPQQAAVTPDGNQNQHPYGGHANIRTTGILGLDPLKHVGYNNYQWTTMVFEGALTRDAEDNIQPGVCDYTVSEDMRTLTLWVRDGMIFHNGDTVDIYDVEASLQRAFNRYGSIKKKVVPYVKSMAVSDDGKTLVLNFTQWREDVYYYLASYQTWCPVMPKEICENYGGKNITNQIEACVGTGPYKVTDYKRSSHITVSRFEDYVVQESDLTGFAGPKYAYLDSVTFWDVDSDGDASQGLMVGTYDVADCMSAEFQSQLEVKSLTTTTLSSKNGWYVYFNTKGHNNITSKYPSLRKAAMAAIDTDALLQLLTGGDYVAARSPILDSTYDETAFRNADYLGAANPELAQKYMEDARAEGWNGYDPLVLVPFGGSVAAETMIIDYLSVANVPVTLIENDEAGAKSWRTNPQNQWDLYFHLTGFATTPTLTQDVILNDYWGSTEKDTLIIQMKLLSPDSPEYMAKWQELSQLWVDDCAIPLLGFEAAVIYHNDKFHCNEDPGVLQRYWFNAYWEDPENHKSA